MTNTLLRIDRDGPVAIVRLTHGVTNPINGELVGELAAAVRHAKEQPDIHGLVLASAGDKFFSIGWDIPQLIGVTRSEFADFFSRYNRMCLDLYTLPKPTVAAITGHVEVALIGAQFGMLYNLVADSFVSMLRTARDYA